METEQDQKRKTSVQTFGRKKTAVAVAHVKPGRGLVKVNGQPLELLNPPTLKWKALEPMLLLKDSSKGEIYENLDIRVQRQSVHYHRWTC